jgi:hypothetical protein
VKDAVDRLIHGDLPYLVVGRNELPRKGILMPGSFNPLHQGHEGLLLAAEQLGKREGMLELSLVNVDKPPLSLVEIERRLLQLHGVYSVVLTCAPTFSEKAELFPGMWFALGYDTALRLLSPEYHDNIPAMLTRFHDLKTRFVVAGRYHEGSFQDVSNLHIPCGFEDLFVSIPESKFRKDISSAELRRGIGS